MPRYLCQISMPNNYSSLVVSFSCTVNKDLHEDTVVFKYKGS